MLFMKISEEKIPLKSDLPDEIVMQVSSFPSMPRAGTKLRELLAEEDVPLDIAEHMVVGTDHAEIGAQILARWSFPDDIVNAVSWRHNPERIKNSTTKLDMVYLSNIMCQPPIDSDSARG